MILKLIKFCSERANNVTIRFILLFGKYIFYIFFVLPEFLLRALVCVSQFYKIRSGNCIIVQRRNAFPHTVRKKLLRGSPLNSRVTSVTTTTQYIFRQFNPTVSLRAPFSLRTDFGRGLIFSFPFFFFLHLM